MIGGSMILKTHLILPLFSYLLSRIHPIKFHFSRWILLTLFSTRGANSLQKFFIINPRTFIFENSYTFVILKSDLLASSLLVGVGGWKWLFSWARAFADSLDIYRSDFAPFESFGSPISLCNLDRVLMTKPPRCRAWTCHLCLTFSILGQLLNRLLKLSNAQPHILYLWKRSNELLLYLEHQCFRLGLRLYKNSLNLFQSRVDGEFEILTLLVE